MTELRRKWLATDRVIATPSGKSIPALPEEEVRQHLWAAAEFLVRSGALDHIVELATLIAMIHDVVTDRMVDEFSQDVIKPMGMLIDTISRSSLVEILNNALMDPELEKTIVNINTESITLKKIISLINDKEVKTGLYIFLIFLKALGRAARSRFSEQQI
ncbi:MULTISPECIES: DUF1641 domain-containing protein [Pyrobaculum]|uniref:DUF1641 domain-containing protein n=1 Tax=Pyrobaculum arsenaticum (strain DSM 13514 / JCM 11321 / PZ6) TaxID=340102 RepID=A4WJC7_PYRAR|nr:DUF1641 domain-containing protein [Pyrobaculum arsenaticum]ABP50494.1 hypothetical protein Pars_0913 [Pyrobaculum arsenaticum DSM 13514]